MENKNKKDILSELDFDFEYNNTIKSEFINKDENLENTLIYSNKDEIKHDILEDLELGELNETNSKQEKIEKKSLFSNLLGFLSFIFKYTITTSLIFGVLLVSTNYSAYIQLAESYLYPERLEQSRDGLYSSISGNNISSQRNINKNSGINNKSNEKNDIQKKEELRKNIGNSLENKNENKTYHSVERLGNSIKNNLSLDINIAPYENRVIVPKIGKNIPLVEVDNKKVKNIGEINDIFMKELVNGVVRYPGSAKPGEIGNSFIFGHSSNFPWLEGNYNDVFALLDNVSFNDEIIIYYEQKKYIYKVREKKVVRPGDTSILKRDNGKAEVTLMTCWPVGTTLNRMIVTGELIEIN